MKHRVMLSLIYVCGLRRGELLNLKPTDILSDRNLLHIKQAKGKKDRVVPISDKVIEICGSIIYFIVRKLGYLRDKLLERNIARRVYKMY